MNFLRAIVIGLSSCFYVQQAQAQTISFPQQFTVGESFSISEVTIRTRRHNDLPAQVEKTTAEKSIEVLDRSANGYRFRLSPTRLEVSSPSPIRKAVQSVLGNTSSECILDTASGLASAKAWRAYVQAVFDDWSANSDLSLGIQAAVTKSFSDLMQALDDTAMGNFLCADLILLAGWDIVEWSIGEPVTIRVPAPNPFGTNPIEFEVEAKLVSREGGIAIIEARQRATKASVEELFVAHARFVGLSEGETAALRREAGPDGLFFHYDQRFELGMADGRPQKVEQNKTVAMGKLLHEEETKILEMTYGN